MSATDPTPDDAAASIEERCAAHALGALDPGERAALDADLARDPAVRALLADLERSAVGVALALAPVTPSPALRSRVLAAIAPGAPAARRAPEPDLEELLVASRVRILGAVCGVLFLAAAGLGVAFMDATQGRARAETNEAWAEHERALLEAELLDLQRTGASLERDVAAGQAARRELDEAAARLLELDQITRLLRDRATRVIPLGPAGPSGPSASGRVLLSGTGREVAFIADNLDRLGDGKSWQLWTIAGGPPSPAGLFGEPGATGALDVAPILVGDPAKVKFAVSLEPAGGSPGPGPSGPVILASP